MSKRVRKNAATVKATQRLGITPGHVLVLRYTALAPVGAHRDRAGRMERGAERVA